jgi:hypothetical protein
MEFLPTPMGIHSRPLRRTGYDLTTEPQAKNIAACSFLLRHNCEHGDAIRIRDVKRDACQDEVYCFCKSCMLAMCIAFILTAKFGIGKQEWYEGTVQLQLPLQVPLYLPSPPFLTILISFACMPNNHEHKQEFALEESVSEIEFSLFPDSNIAS